MNELVEWNGDMVDRCESGIREDKSRRREESECDECWFGSVELVVFFPSNLCI